MKGARSKNCITLVIYLDLNLSMTPSIHFSCLLTDFLYQWKLQLIRKSDKFYVIQRREGYIKRLLNGGDINSAWAIIQTVLSDPFQTAVIQQHLNISLSSSKLIKHIDNDDTYTIVGINTDGITIAKVGLDDNFANATTIQKYYSAPTSLYRLFDKVLVNHKQGVIIKKC